MVNVYRIYTWYIPQVYTVFVHAIKFESSGILRKDHYSSINCLTGMQVDADFKSYVSRLTLKMAREPRVRCSST